MKENNYSVTLNSDRAHLVLDGTPVQTFLFSDYEEPSDAIGLAVAKALKISGRTIHVKSMGYLTEKERSVAKY